MAPQFRFKIEEQATALASGTGFGLVAYSCSCDIGCVWRVAEALEYGIEDCLELKYQCMAV